MPWNALIFPLIAGYYLLSNTNLFRFTYEKMDHQRLLFESALAGTGMGVISYIFKEILEFFSPEIYKVFLALRPIDVPLIGTSMCTLLFSIILTALLNMIFPKSDGLRRAIKKRGNEMELLLRDSLEKSRMVAVTLLSNKVYVGWVNEVQIPSNSGYIRIIPTLSGYRDKSHKFVFNNHYLNVYSDLVKTGKYKSLKEFDTDVIIAVSQIAHLSNFDLDLYGKFEENDTTLPRPNDNN